MAERPSSLSLTDLDQRPELTTAALALFADAGPGQHHVVCGIPERMGLPPMSADLGHTWGVVIAARGLRLAGALALCRYSEQQVTLWGPALGIGADAYVVGGRLLTEVRTALKNAGYESMRALVDTRNRAAKAFFLDHGFTAWKGNHLYEHELLTDAREAAADTIANVRLATPSDHDAVAKILTQGFPDSDHARTNLAKREREGYRHYLLESDAGIVAAAAIEREPLRSWLKLIAVRRDQRGRHLGRKLLSGLLTIEASYGTRRVGLEVLADNHAAIALYESCGFQRPWSMTILTGPV